MHARRHSSSPWVVDLHRSPGTSAAGLVRSLRTCARGSGFVALSVVVQTDQGPDVLSWPADALRQRDVAAAPGREALEGGMVVVRELHAADKQRLGIDSAIRCCVSVPIRDGRGTPRAAITAWSAQPASTGLVMQAEAAAELLAGPLQKQVGAGWQQAEQPIPEPPQLPVAVHDLLQRAADEALSSAVASCGALAHELNNAVTAILLDTDLLGGQLPDNDATAAIVERLLGSTERVVTLGTLLKMSSGCGGTETAPVDLSFLVQDVVATVRAGLPSNVDLALEIDPQPLRLQGEDRQLAIAVRALVDNAVEAAATSADPGGARVDVHLCHALLLPTAARALGLSASGRYVKLSVRDNGAGMPASVLHRCTQPFYSTRPARLGLGLSAANGLALAMGGTLKISSVPGDGARVELLLPVG